MKFSRNSLTCLLAALSILLSSCVQPDTTPAEKEKVTTKDLINNVINEKKDPLSQLPVRYQKPSYVTNSTDTDKSLDKDIEYEIKVGANIRSTQGPQPLWDIMKRLASLKNMSVSWSSDVDQNLLVDVDIKASDNFFDAIDNLLRQVDYFHEVKGTTIIINFKETKRYHVAMPFIQQKYNTSTGGNLLGSGDDTSSVEGIVKLYSEDNEFDVWKNIQENLNAIIATWSTTAITEEPAVASKGDDEKDGEEVAAAPTRQKSIGGNNYTIDKPIGLITVNAPRPLQKKIEAYLERLKHELYKQVTIEAKIIEVQLRDDSTLGIDWNTLVKSLSFSGGMNVGSGYSRNNTRNSSNNNNISGDFKSVATNTHSNQGELAQNNSSDSLGEEISAESTVNTINTLSSLTKSSIVNAATSAATLLTGFSAKTGFNNLGGTMVLSSFNFDDFIHALSEQGNTSILANPKLSVMNGEPSMITVGRNVTYIDSIEANVSSGDNPIVTYTANTERVLSGVGMSITPIVRDDNKIIMNIVPVTSVLEEPIEYRTVGLGEVGLPVINLREMNTTVQVNDGEMLVIGGLISSVESTEGGNLFPKLSDVPVLKYLTGYETKKMIKRELIILLRPRIL